MCYNQKAFENLKRLLNKKTVYLADESEVGAYGIGAIRLNPETVLKEVLYVPDFTVNVCSVGMLAKGSFKVTFKESGCILSKDGQEAIHGIGKNLDML